MTRMVPVNDLCSAYEIAGALGVSLSRVYELIHTEPSFPAPVATLARKTRLWLMSEVLEWWASSAAPPNRKRKPKSEHGKLSMYSNGRCRCELCRAAMSAYTKAYRAGARGVV